jgi:hypothetical protein
MTPEDADAITDRLAATLAELVVGLHDNGYQEWAAWAARDRDMILRGDGHGLEHFLSAFGGSGSINDLLLPRPLQARLSSAHDDATVLLRAVRAHDRDHVE